MVLFLPRHKNDVENYQGSASSWESAIRKYQIPKFYTYVFLIFSVIMAYIRVGAWTQSYLQCGTWLPYLPGIFGNPSYFCMCNFVSGNKFHLALLAQTKLHIQKCNEKQNSTIKILQWYSTHAPLFESPASLHAAGTCPQPGARVMRTRTKFSNNVVHAAVVHVDSWSSCTYY